MSFDMFIVFMFGFLVGAFLKQWGDRSLLEHKALPEYRTPLKIGEKFYYIVEESDYVTNYNH